MHPPSRLLLRALRQLNRLPHPPSQQLVRHSPSLCAVRHVSTSLPTQDSVKPPPALASASASATRSTAPLSTDRGPQSEETTQTDFAALNVLGNMAPPSTAIDACLPDGFQLDNGIEIRGGGGVLLVHGEVFRWRPWEAGSETEGKELRNGSGMPASNLMLNTKGQWEVDDAAWGLLECVWPKPELLILGLGRSMHPLSPKTKLRINSLGIRLDIQDTRNAAAQFNLLATERGVGTVAAAMLPVGWRGR